MHTRQPQETGYPADVKGVELFIEDTEGELDAVGLFDVSGGRGKLPVTWPKPYYLDTTDGRQAYAYCGYAGGLTPSNLAGELARINDVVGAGQRLWIDMESGVRSEVNGQSVFDLGKVRSVLEIASGRVKAES